MSKTFKYAAAIILALTLAITGMWLSRQGELKASETDGFNTASELMDMIENAGVYIPDEK